MKMLFRPGSGGVTTPKDAGPLVGTRASSYPTLKRFGIAVLRASSRSMAKCGHTDKRANCRSVQLIWDIRCCDEMLAAGGHGNVIGHDDCKLHRLVAQELLATRSH